MMSNDKSLLLPELFNHVAEVEQETRKCLGDDAGFFINVYNDCLDILIAIRETTPEPEQYNLVLHVTDGLLKEIHWFHLFFIAGNYPLLNSRLRYVWEAVYRAYFAETHPEAPPSMDDKLVWLENRKQRPDWNNCISPVLREVCPPVEKKPDLFDHYHGRWQELNQYVHPSAYVLDRMIDESALHVRDAFDETWARDTVAAGRDVFDLVWLAILLHHPLAIPKVASEGLIVRYPAVGTGLEGFKKMVD